MSNVARFAALLLTLTTATAWLACSSSTAAPPAADAGGAGDDDDDDDDGTVTPTPPPTVIDTDAAVPDGGITTGCFDEFSCPVGQFCKQDGAEPSGVCTAVPTTCAGQEGSPAAFCQCLQTQSSPSCTNRICGRGTNASAGTTQWLLSCNSPAAPARTQGQTCSAYLGCVDGQMCQIPGPGQAGTCQPVPTTCTTSGNPCLCIVQQTSGTCSNAQCEAQQSGINDTFWLFCGFN